MRELQTVTLQGDLKMTKRGLSIERHREIGRELARITYQLAPLLTEIANAYPQKCPVYKFAMGPSAPDQKLYELRAELENRMFAEYPDADTSVYFPPGHGEPDEAVGMTNDQFAAIARARSELAVLGSPEWGTALALITALNGSQTTAGARRLLRWYTAATRTAALALLLELEQAARP